MSDRTFGQIADSRVESVTNEEGAELRYIQFSQHNGMVHYEMALPGERWESFFAYPDDVVFLDSDSAEAVDAGLAAQ